MRREVTVLAYHAVGTNPSGSDPLGLFVPLDRFEWQMSFLARHARVVPAAKLFDPAFHPVRRTVVLTFDDAHRSIATHAAPILRRHGLTATLFVPTASVGGRNTWELGSEYSFAVMAEDELREVQQLGIELGSHGSAHLDLSAASGGEAESDLDASVRFLTALTGEPPRHFAYPYSTGSAAAQAVAATRFDAAFSFGRPHVGRYAYARVPVYPADGRLAFSLKAFGWYPLLRWSAFGETARRLLRAKPS